MGSRLFTRALPLAAALGLALSALPASAFRLVPIEMEFEPSGRGATQIFRIENDKDEPIAVEVTVMARGQNPDGQDILSDAGDDWIVFPEQIILEPGQNQSVRVQWAGTATPPKELAYRLIAAQQPIDIGKAPPQGGQVRLLVQYVASVYVMPPGVKANLSVTGAQAAKGPDGPALEVTVQNTGTTRQILRDPTLTVQAGGKSVALTGEVALNGLTGENVLAGSTRQFVLPWPAGLPVGPVTVSLRVP